MKIRNILINNAGLGAIPMLAVLGLPLALLIACVVAIVISLVWGILAFVGLILVFVGGYAVISKKHIKLALPIIILGIVLILCSTTLGLEIGTFNFADLPLFKEVL